MLQFLYDVRKHNIVKDCIVCFGTKTGGTCLYFLEELISNH